MTTRYKQTSQIPDAIAQVEKLLEALKLMDKYPDKEVDSFYLSGAFDLLDDCIDIKYDSLDYQADISYLGDGSIMEDCRKLSIKLDLDIRQLGL